MISANIDLERIELERIRFRSFAQGVEAKPCRRIHAAPTPSARSALWPAKVDPAPFIPKNADRRRERAREILRMQCAGLTERLRKTGIARVVIGVSGGLDSTLALLVAAAAGANVIVNLSASNETAGKAKFRRELVRLQSARSMCAYVYASSGEGESTTDLVFSGHLLAAAGGRIAAESIWHALRNF